MNEFEKLCKEYAEKFDEGYGVVMCDDRSIEEHIALLKEALATGIPIPTEFEGILE